MAPLDLIDPSYTVSGLGVGLLVGLTGVGGGALMTPLLVLLFGVHPSTAVGTDLLFAAVTKSVGTAAHGLDDSVDWRVTRRLATGSVPAAATCVLILSWLGAPGPAVEHLIGIVLGTVLLLTAASLLFRTQIVAYVSRRFGEPRPERAALLTVVTGAVLGVLVSLSSIGAGALGMTVLVMLYPMLPLARLAGSDIAHAVPLALIAGLGHWYLGAVDWGLLASLLTGSVPGIIVGSLLAGRVPEPVLRPLLAGTLLLVGIRLVA